LLTPTFSTSAYLSEWSNNDDVDGRDSVAGLDGKTVTGASEAVILLMSQLRAAKKSGALSGSE